MGISMQLLSGNDSRSVHVSIREMATDKLLPLEEPSEVDYMFTCLEIYSDSEV